jgi:hypothetical protein
MSELSTMLISQMAAGLTTTQESNELRHHLATGKRQHIDASSVHARLQLGERVSFLMQRIFASDKLPAEEKITLNKDVAEMLSLLLSPETASKQTNNNE